MTATTLEYRCLSCGKAFTVTAGRIPASGGKGHCTACGAALTIFPDGRIRLAPSSGGFASAPHPIDEPIWGIRLANPNPDFSPGPYRLADVRSMIVEGRLIENDLARVLDGDWQPISSFHALNAFFSDKVRIGRERHGDEEHCSLHRDQSPGWRCPKCQNFLCKLCVVNRPVIAGGSPYYLCAACETEAVPLKGKSLLQGLVPGLFKKGT